MGDDVLACAVALGAVTGARRGELGALRWSDIAWDQGLVRIARSLTVIKRQVLQGRRRLTRSLRSPSMLSWGRSLRLEGPSTSPRPPQSPRAPTCGPCWASRSRGPKHNSEGVCPRTRAERSRGRRSAGSDSGREGATTEKGTTEGPMMSAGLLGG